MSTVTRSSLLIFLDTETTGLNPSVHRILEVAFRVLDSTTGKDVCSYQSIVTISPQDWKKASRQALKVNGFTKTTIDSQGKDPETIAWDIIALFRKHKIFKSNAYFLCLNPSFDRQFFSQIISENVQEAHGFPMRWLDFANMEVAIRFKNDVETDKKHAFLPLSKDSIAKRYGVLPEQKPHRAMNGVDHLLAIYQKVIGFQRNS